MAVHYWASSDSCHIQGRFHKDLAIKTRTSPHRRIRLGLLLSQASGALYKPRPGQSIDIQYIQQSYHRLASRVQPIRSRGRSTLVLPISSILIKQEQGITSIERARTWVKHRVPCLLLPLALDAQIGTPYPRSTGFDTNTHASDPYH